jgi:CTP synthase (UTP-ammonia lyase)
LAVRTVHVAVVGDYQADHVTHPATNASVGHAAESVGCAANVEWIPTIDVPGRARSILGSYDGVVIAPGSPYASMQGALEAITFARENRVPLLATCGGFQYVVIEHARQILGFSDAQHAEYDPTASALFITALSCSLAGQTMDVTLKPGTGAASAYDAQHTTEHYYCNFGLNPAYRGDLECTGLVVSGVDQNDEVRILELTGHPFFVATLFVPQMSSTRDAPHPLVHAFISACADRTP